MRGILNMAYRLTENVQVRKESWGLLFYSPAKHKVCFIRSGDWLYPHHFDGSWTPDGLVNDIARRLDNPAKVVEHSLRKLTDYLIDSEMMIDELC